LIGWGGEDGGSSDPRPPLIKETIWQKTHKVYRNMSIFTTLCWFSHNQLLTIFFMSNWVVNQYLFT
jgi:hypothetical protein